MATQNCAVAKDCEPEDCAHGCRDFGCCIISLGGENSHHCLSQLLKRLGRDPSKTDKCGACKTKLKETNDSRGNLEADRRLPRLPNQ